MVRLIALAVLLSTLPGCMLAAVPIWPGTGMKAQPGATVPVVGPHSGR